MVDITKCTGIVVEEKGTITCPFRNQCRRFTEPAGQWQSFFTSTPLKWEPVGVPTCDHKLSHWTKQAREPGSTYVAHEFELGENTAGCKRCGWPKENHK